MTSHFQPNQCKSTLARVLACTAAFLSMMIIINRTMMRSAMICVFCCGSVCVRRTSSLSHDILIHFGNSCKILFEAPLSHMIRSWKKIRHPCNVSRTLLTCCTHNCSSTSKNMGVFLMMCDRSSLQFSRWCSTSTDWIQRVSTIPIGSERINNIWWMNNVSEQLNCRQLKLAQYQQRNQGQI